MSPAEARIKELLEGTGITIDGKDPWDLQVHDHRFYRRVLADGSLGFGESYMDGWWDCGRIDRLVDRLLRARIQDRLGWNVPLLWEFAKAKLFNAQSRARAFRIGEAHYDIGNDLYRAMLDSRMVYTCAYWKDASDLDAAQEAKLDLVCRKLGLKPGDRVLDIGCGWGSFVKFAAERYGVRAVGITVSKEQAALARESCQGLPVEIRLQDYRDVNEPFDHVMSLGMFEHVGPKNFREYHDVVRRCLKDEGLFLLHTIGSLDGSKPFEPWTDRYIFPGAHLPDPVQMTRAAQGLFVMEDWHNFGPDYDRTLMAWHANIERRWDELGAYDERFRRMWRYYLLTCAGSFRARENQLWQIVYSKHGVPGGYASIR